MPYWLKNSKTITYSSQDNQRCTSIFNNWVPLLPYSSCYTYYYVFCFFVKLYHLILLLIWNWFISEHGFWTPQTQRRFCLVQTTKFDRFNKQIWDWITFYIDTNGSVMSGAHMATDCCCSWPSFSTFTTGIQKWSTFSLPMLSKLTSCLIFWKR